MQKHTPESLAQEVLDSCGGCQQCRWLFEDGSCPFFLELYRLCDRETELGVKPTSAELRSLIDLCNFCGMCLCPWIRIIIREAKDAFVERDGLQPSIRLLEDVRRVGIVCGAYPKLTNLVLQHAPSAALLKRFAGIHPGRRLPRFPKESFMAWAQKRGLDRKRGGNGRKVAYFAGCTAQFLFPGVAKATVEVLEHNGVEVYCPEQRCCGMPPLLEGDRPRTLEFGAFNLEQLGAAVEMGYDVVCSCPTCGYMLKNVFTEEVYAKTHGLFEVGGDIETTGAESEAAGGLDLRQRKLTALLKLAESSGLEDSGHFRPLDVRQRLAIARSTYDLGEYLGKLRQAGLFKSEFAPVKSRIAYFPPCHVREQRMGEPWRELLSLIPELSLERVGESQCCGMAGIMGFKRDFHEASVAMGTCLAEQVKAVHPQRVACECLSCRMQFDQLLPYPVSHPIEVLKEAYGL